MQVSNTKKPPIELISHFFSEVELKARAEALTDVLAQKEIGYTFRMDVQFSPIEGRSEYQITLTVWAEDCPGKVKAYDIKVQAVGFVQVDGAIPKDKQAETATILGSSLLYSAAREHLYALSLRGPYPAVYLPTTSFIPDDSKEEAESSPPASEKKAKRKSKDK